ncbi:hypothetical protein CA54_10570 [Symmachiella macrocystis]|uniref:Bacterial type II secretion system protein G n=1 Tax=Symmachiella macrocystis TaxID=2527985 RepID=A0A5C6BNT2_9PLAN|nr:hypothetical protein [Symmachiella macrocystis]TWU12234.1 hypothetical protein CA54_10570 [Symmachiella macrocystis]
MEAPPPKSSWTPAKLLIFVAGVLLIGTFAIIGFLWYSSHARLKADLADLRAAGSPTNAAELADFYKVPVGVSDTTGVWVEVIDHVTATSQDQMDIMMELPVVGEGPTPIPPPGTEWAQLDAVEELLAKFEPELQAARAEVGINGQVRFPIDFSQGIRTLLPYTQETRQVARLLLLDAQVAAHRGDDARALQDLRAIFALSDTLRGEPVLISQLVRGAIHAIGCEAITELMPHCDWSDDDLAALQSSVRAANFREEVARAMHGERALYLTELNRMRLGPLRVRNMHTAIELFKYSDEVFDGSWTEMFQKGDEFKKKLRERRNGTSLLLPLDTAALQLVPAIESAIQYTASLTARQRFVNAGIAASRYRLQQEQFPDSLSDLNEELLGAPLQSSEELIDPFDENPLRYRQEETQIIIYSVGSDGIDNGGDCVSKAGTPNPLDLGIVLPK